MAGGHDAGQHAAVAGLELLVVAALVGEVEGLQVPGGLVGGAAKASGIVSEPVVQRVQRLGVGRAGRVDVLFPVEGHGQPREAGPPSRRHVLGIGGDGGREVFKGRVRVAGLQMGVGPVAQQVHVAGAQRQGLIKAHQGLVRPSIGFEGRGQVAQRARRVRIQYESPLVAGDRLFRAVQGEQGAAQAVPGRSGVRGQLGRPALLGLGLGRAAQAKERGPTALPDLGIVRDQLGRAAKGGLGLGEVACFEPGQPEKERGLCQVGTQPQDPAVEGSRFVEPPGRLSAGWGWRPWMAGIVTATGGRVQEDRAPGSAPSACPACQKW